MLVIKLCIMCLADTVQSLLRLLCPFGFITLSFVYSVYYLR